MSITNITIREQALERENARLLNTIRVQAEAVRKDEREACALIAQQTVCDTYIPTGVKIYGAYAAKAIRARITT